MRYRILAWSLYVAALSVVAASMAGVLSANDFLPYLASACLFTGFLCDRYARRLRAPEAHSIVARNPDGFVLLLRCFSAEDYSTLGESGLGPKFEEALVTTLRLIGPVVAVGRPDEPLAPLGAPRLYIRSEHWQPEVENLMRQACAVVLMLFTRNQRDGSLAAAGFRWEIERA